DKSFERVVPQNPSSLSQSRSFENRCSLVKNLRIRVMFLSHFMSCTIVFLFFC
ncbi:hypothetical protein TorRG33x02_331120, partial [Trema orientale]